MSVQLNAGSNTDPPLNSNCKHFLRHCTFKTWDLVQPLARLWGLITTVVMSGAGAELATLGNSVGPGLLVGAMLLLILETMWVAALFVDLLCRRGQYSISLKCWDFARWSCARIRAPLYACVATAILFANLSNLSSISGGLLLVLACLRAAVPFAPNIRHNAHTHAGSTLLSQLDSPQVDSISAQEERFEEMTILDATPEGSEPVSPKPPLLDL